MFNEHFGIEENPFSIAPDPRYLYMSEGHQEAFAHLLYGIKGEGGFVLLTGEVGTGKTTVCRCLLEQSPPDTNIAIILNPKLSSLELLASICDELQISYPEGTQSIKVLVDRINTFLLQANASGRETVLVIDEAQNLDSDVLEQIRLLTNLETNERKLLRIVMLGQPELQQKLARPELRQLAQRITARYHLGALQKKEIAPYLAHRLSIAGISNSLFSKKCVDKLYPLSNGIPRLINILCDRAMLGAYVQGQDRVDENTLVKAAKEVFGNSTTRYNRPVWAYRFGLGLLLIAVIGVITLALARFGKDLDETPDRSAIAVESFGPSLKLSDTLPVIAVVEPVAAMTRDSAKTVAAEETLTVPDPQPEFMPWPEVYDRSRQSAYESLFHQWGIHYLPARDGDPCHYAALSGLQCLDLQGNVEHLTGIDRPALLTLTDRQGNSYYASVINVQGSVATMFFSDHISRINVDEIGQHWFGKYTILWRPPPGYRTPMLRGHQGDEVRWMEEKLAGIQGTPVPAADGAVYDEALATQVKLFQFDNALKPDGIVGPQTLIRLNTLAGSDVPTLNRAGKDR